MHEERRRTWVLERWPTPAARLLWMLLLLKPLLLLLLELLVLLLGCKDPPRLLHADRQSPAPSTGNRESRKGLPADKPP